MDEEEGDGVAAVGAVVDEMEEDWIGEVGVWTCGDCCCELGVALGRG